MDGSTLGAAIALMKKNKPTDEQIESAVDNWLDDHPEATTTVQDGSITKAKLDSNLQGTVDEVDDLKDIVAIQSTQPTYSDNKIWIDTTNTPTGIEVPTYTELTDLMNALFSEIHESMVAPSDWGTITGNSDASRYLTNKKYPKGYIKNANLLIHDDTDQSLTVYIYKDNGDNTCTLVDSFSGTGHGTVSIPINLFIEYDFYVAVNAKNLGFKNISSFPYLTKKTTDTTVDLSANNKTYAFAYEIVLMSFNDIINNLYKDDEYLLENDKLSFQAFNTTITSSNYESLGFTDVVSLPKNRVFRIDNSLPASFYLPETGRSYTLLKFAPYKSDYSTTAYTSYFAFGYKSTGIKLYYAYSITNQSADALEWVDITSLFDSFAGLSNEVIHADNTTISASNYASLGYTDVVSLPLNRIYRFSNDMPESFYLPGGSAGYHTLIKISPYLNDSTSTGWCMYFDSVSVDGTKRFYCAYALANQLASELSWYEIGERQNVCLKNIGTKAIKIAFIGDSIVSGVGSSDFNGGEQGTSGHLIPNTFKTWYRNTGTKCWVNKMISYLTSNYTDVIAVNNGIGSIDTINVYENLATLAVDDDGNLVDIAVIACGTNDWRKNEREGGMNTYITGYMAKIIKWLQDRKIQPIILTNTPRTDHTVAPQNAPTIQAFLIRGCERAGIHAVPIMSKVNNYLWEHNLDLQDDFLSDGVHPSDTGYEIMFELIKELLNV